MEAHIENLTEGLVKRGHEVTIITASHPEGIEEENRDDIKIHYLDSEPKYFRRKFYKESAELFGKLDEDFDIVHSHSSLGAGYVKYCGDDTPFVVTDHGTPLNEIRTVLSGKYPLKYFLAMPFWTYRHFFVEPEVFESADRIISPSYQLRDDIISQYGIENEKNVVIPHGIDTEKYKPVSDVSEVRERYRVSEDEKVILSVGRMVKSKGYHILLKAFSEVVESLDAKLIMVGTGPDLSDFKELSDELGISDGVVFTGKVSDEDLIDLYTLADLFVHPTLWFSEVFGLVIAEAMACGTPVIASRIGGVPTVVDERGVGFLFDPGNEDELTEKILRILTDERLSSKFEANCREEVVKNFSLDRMIEDTIECYEEL
ncbi:hypothetical protein AKJ53_00965 [candidate division MSBL1 archaeon SCGC-AAA382F02]|uniref:Glycosyl transferase family 1 n=1 Tax=candidate division MSBL1 archaeon SCGC-AAA382F02 TaxID=1698282 RepID=A0A133VIH6_9EURY|nr:hypothetical protein AKJ53_00965 [candidate division MSBL1 archaeon SCGC-AAA382F02]